jgi:hypothetical protein
MTSWQYLRNVDSPPPIPEFTVTRSPDGGWLAVHKGDPRITVTAPDHARLALMCAAARIRRTWALA